MKESNQMITKLYVVPVTFPNGEIWRVGNFTSLKQAASFRAQILVALPKIKVKTENSSFSTCSPDAFLSYHAV